MKALIDGDIVVYMCCAAQQITGDFDDGHGEEVMFDVEEATSGAMRMIRNWTKKAGCKHPIVCFTGDTNFRKRIYPEYKANRTAEKPKAYLDVREAIEIEYETWCIEGLEADDVMGIAGSRDPNNFVVVSRDKDMLTIPGRVFNPDHDKKPRLIRREVADKLWMMQTMMGDKTDNYPGIPKVGEVKAQEILTDPHTIIKAPAEYYKSGKNKGKMKPDKWVRGHRCSLWDSMKSYATRYGTDETHLIKMARVARILRTGEFDTNTRTVKLWLPGGGYEDLQLD